MDNPYRSPVETEELPQRPHPAINPSYRIDQLEKRFNRLRWCTAFVYLLALAGNIFPSSRIGPYELVIVIALPILGLFVTRKQ